MSNTMKKCLITAIIAIVALTSSISGDQLDALDVSQLKIEETKLFVPSLHQLAEALSTGLSKNYANLTVKVVYCPDLTKEPFDLASSGLSGSPTLLDIGDAFYRTPKPNKTKTYDFINIARTMLPKMKTVSFIGPGVGPYDQLNMTTQAFLSSKVSKNGEFLSKSRIEYYHPSDNSLQFGTVPSNQTKFSLEGFLFASEGRGGKVIQIKAKKRVGSEGNFSGACRKAIIDAFGNKTIGMGGTFYMNSGSAYYHRKSVYGELPAPVVAVGRFLTNLPHVENELNSLEDHFHGYSGSEWAAHYHYDTTPNEIDYEAYLNVAERVIRIDRPNSFE